MSFPLHKSKLRQTERTSAIIDLTTLRSPSADDRHSDSNVNSLKKTIEDGEKTLNVFINHVLMVVDANIDDLKFSINKKRPSQKLCKVSVCDLWIRLKAIKSMKPVALATHLRKCQLSRSEVRPWDTDGEKSVANTRFSINPRRSRFTHLHMVMASDQFHLEVGSFVGLVVFSYENQSKFILNGHHCRRGDVIVKQIKHFSSTLVIHRDLYNALFKWYFGHLIDERFVGIGFLCANGRWCFDLLARGDNEILPFEHRIFDMFMLTHWLTQSAVPQNVRDMEILTRNVLLNEFSMMEMQITNSDRTELLSAWNEFVGSDNNDLMAAIRNLLDTIESEIKIVVKDLGSDPNAV